MSLLRAFIAIQIPDKIKNEIAADSVELHRAGDRSVRWVAPGNIHLTVKFLGNIAAAKLGTLGRALVKVTSQHNPFSLTIADIGAFPNLRHPRVIWIGVNPTTALNSLEGNIGKALAELGFSIDDKPFSAHLTIGRVRDQATPAQIRALTDALTKSRPGELGTFAVETIHLLQSELQPAGPVYTHLFAAALGGQLLHEVKSESA